MDPRHEKRLHIVQNLFAYSFPGKARSLPHPPAISEDIVNHLYEVDEKIKKFAPKYPIQRIARVDLAVLRLAIYELIVTRKEPEKVIINEAVELAKELGGDRSFAFVNAVLGAVVTQDNTV